MHLHPQETWVSWILTFLSSPLTPLTQSPQVMSSGLLTLRIERGSCAQCPAVCTYGLSCLFESQPSFMTLSHWLPSSTTLCLYTELRPHCIASTEALNCSMSGTPSMFVKCLSVSLYAF